MFHRIQPEAPAAFGLPGCYRIRGTSLTPEEFEQTLDPLGPVIPLEAVENALRAGQEPPCATVLTFDDGYREHVDVVAPLLVKRGMTATFYVATGLHGAGRDVAVVDAWYWLLDHARSRVATESLPDGGRFEGRVDTIEGKRLWVEGAPKAALLASSRTQQRAMLAELQEHLDGELPDGLATSLYMTPTDWSTLVDLGMRIGAHSVGHPRLTQLDDVALDAEVGESVARVAERSPRVAFAFPDGAHSERVRAALRRAGVSSAVTCEPGVVMGTSELMRLARRFVAAPQ